MKIKICSECKQEKPLTEFHKREDSKDGLRGSCKKCKNAYGRAYYQLPKARAYKKAYAQSSKVKACKKVYGKAWRESPKGKAYMRVYHQSPKEKARKKAYNQLPEVKAHKTAYMKDYAQLLGVKVRMKAYKQLPKWKAYLKNYTKAYHKKRRKEDMGFKILCNLRTRIHHALKNNVKSKATKELLGCTISQLKVYLKLHFQPGMTFDNYGKWHIDHIKPCGLFDLSNPEEQKKCFHFTNLQPLWAEDNFKKSDKF